MADTIRIRATLHGDVADVRVAIPHPMETGLRKDDKGQLVPLHFIAHLTATHNGKIVMDAQLSQGLSKDPFLAFRVKGARTGDKIAIAWVDNRGEKGAIETAVRAS